ncbi:bifunctional (p)ppGpp synthetase/guanosine-3',5'-bis(diphosphate) 3'-pyrophosphohydrolase [Gemmata sp. G18]|uniref:Bifunctional (P)ppGpp synthetase/guanosine-3',5'-bis(Diphosphate) 3'-pyrophosphohydrolase n=1 Tax=Gemmata palustris TaxID=2822762 RepID=A0ABS5BZJ3_9BACT|nr:HD domain-containing protein [Gemmata palustris]MBP3958318.1 bifunctional (p)ppGpp synthetase/guanosine-3',5'-bis(diphosphate) 3'-pyrophosphohydrolase [Gemmata palustris]
MKQPLTDLPTLALGFATCAHHQQKRKYTGEPYVNHCSSVARIVAEYTSDEAVIAAAILHDVLEDTEVTESELRNVFGERVAALVAEVTDPIVEGNRAVRKQAAREHLARSSPEGATIKLADLIDNTSSIVAHDKGFARTYLGEKGILLEVLRHGDSALWKRAFERLQAAQRELVQHRLGEGA